MGLFYIQEVLRRCHRHGGVISRRVLRRCHRHEDVSWDKMVCTDATGIEVLIFWRFYAGGKGIDTLARYSASRQG
ncbi:unknown protein [Desulfotalea psychrophila LSv54]|uniref:Uncharacterized protein n=1 Tax=Desulfotalea psychrophila (strain LSv54 / DSM 12343) TaxID=177439 RepID=Q6AK62_DESPS|nr:unknown protein [Desulfotalea psychrophila LSv54]